MQRSRYTHTAKQVFPYSQESTTSSLPYLSLVYNTPYSFIGETVLIIGGETVLIIGGETVLIIGGEPDLIGSIFDVFSSRLLQKIGKI